MAPVRRFRNAPSRNRRVVGTPDAASRRPTTAALLGSIADGMVIAGPLLESDGLLGAAGARRSSSGRLSGLSSAGGVGWAGGSAGGWAAAVATGHGCAQGAMQSKRQHHRVVRIATWGSYRLSCRPRSGRDADGQERPGWDSNPRKTDLQSVPLDHSGTRPGRTEYGGGKGASIRAFCARKKPPGHKARAAWINQRIQRLKLDQQPASKDWT